jgi:PTS system mannose-specific IIB component/fructoselysine and glucoselysine-specific PTS system IIB component
MSILLFRVDERLIHGQVVVGWGGHLRPVRYVVIDDPLAISDWEQDLYRLGVPDETEVEFVDVETGRERLAAWRESPTRTVVLARDLATVLALAEGGTMEGDALNLGGLHSREGKTGVLPYLFLDAADKEALEVLAEEGVLITAQDLPGSPKVGLESLVR